MATGTLLADYLLTALMTSKARRRVCTITSNPALYFRKREDGLPHAIAAVRVPFFQPAGVGEAVVREEEK